MKAILCRASCALALIAALGGAPASAEEITLRFELPEAPLAIFGVQYSADFLAPGHVGTLLRTRLVVRFRTEATAGSFPDAAEILFQLQPPTETVEFWSVSGADLGWSGTGEFTATIESDAVAGPLLEVDPGASHLWFVRIVADSAAPVPLGGQLIESYFEADLEVQSPCRVDLTGDGELDFFDFLAFQNLFAAGDPQADFTGDGTLDFFDFLAFQNEFAAGCP